MRNFLMIVAIGLVACGSIYIYNVEGKKLTQGQKLCKEMALEQYHAVAGPLLVETVSSMAKVKLDTRHGTQELEEGISEINRHMDPINELDKKYLEKWWECHIHFISQEDKREIEKEGRWEDYSKLPTTLADIWTRYPFESAMNLLIDYGHRNSSFEIRRFHPE